MNVSSHLENLKQQILIENLCPELSGQAIQIVFGSGKPNSEIVFIGEAPGKKEDESGHPFVGASGKSLDKMLESIALTRDDVYITNIVKYRPPGNRDPRKSEKERFLPYLLKQIEIINPKLIITLGRHSMDVLLPGLIISQVHGELQEYEGRYLLPLYHPAAAMYNGKLRQTLQEDFAKIPSILETLNN
jgi:uracil-DNA glycosylase family 4